MKRLLLFVIAVLYSTLALSVVNINTATKEELDALPGIGPVKSQAIIDYRKANGPFKTPEDIMKVKGIKEGEFSKLKGEISVSGPTSAPAAAAPAKAPAPPASTAAKSEPTKDDKKAAAPAKAMTPKEEKAAKDKAAKEEKAAKDKATKDSKAAKDTKAAKDVKDEATKK
jgi:competence protein ComEA